MDKNKNVLTASQAQVESAWDYAHAHPVLGDPDAQKELEIRRVIFWTHLVQLVRDAQRDEADRTLTTAKKPTARDMRRDFPPNALSNGLRY